MLQITITPNIKQIPTKYYTTNLFFVAFDDKQILGGHVTWIYRYDRGFSANGQNPLGCQKWGRHQGVSLGPLEVRA